MKTRGFTLIELLVVISIIAILAAMLFPVFAAMRSAAYQYGAASSIRQVNQAATMYASDSDETYMPAMYVDGSGGQAWFGRRSGPTSFDPTRGLVYPYEKSTKLHDATANAKEYLGDHSGYGYNWGFIGSDFHITHNYSTFPQCTNAANTSQLANTGATIVFATSAFYNPTWVPRGDGQTYDFGFIDPVSYRPGNPNIDFRHIQSRVVDSVAHAISYPGNAVFAFADGHTSNLKISQVKDDMFDRTGQ